jgi:hypothetical protein
MFASVPEFKAKFDVSYEDIYSPENIEKFGDLIPPVISINNQILTEGHVPIMKKLARDLFHLITPASNY